MNTDSGLDDRSGDEALTSAIKLSDIRPMIDSSSKHNEERVSDLKFELK